MASFYRYHYDKPAISYVVDNLTHFMGFFVLEWFFTCFQFHKTVVITCTKYKQSNALSYKPNKKWIKNFTTCFTSICGCIKLEGFMKFVKCSQYNLHHVYIIIKQKHATSAKPMLHSDISPQEKTCWAHSQWVITDRTLYLLHWE